MACYRDSFTFYLYLLYFLVAVAAVDKAMCKYRGRVLDAIRILVPYLTPL
jgi:hypothetical protein